MQLLDFINLAVDSQRRDLTINAIAMDLDTSEFYDPLNGMRDLASKSLRHCSSSFGDDPLRVLRVARFRAQFFEQGFTVHKDTIKLMQDMVKSGELNSLTPERVWQETVKALSTSNPSAYFDTLLQCGALEVLFPEIHALLGVEQPAKHHPEIDTYIHVMMCVDLAAKSGASPEQVFAALVHDLGKGITPKEMIPHHYGHEEEGVPLVDAMCDRLKIPNTFRWLGANVSRYHLNVHTAMSLNAKTLTNKLISMGALQNYNRFLSLLEVCKYDARGRLGLEDREYPQEQFMINAAKVLKSLSYKDLAAKYQNAKLVDMIRKYRYQAIKQYISAYKDEHNVDLGNLPANDALC